MGGSVDFVDLVSSLLDSGNFNEAFNVVNDDKYKQCFNVKCWDLIAAVVDKVQDDTIIIKPSLYGACERMLSAVLERCTPEEALLEFIERIELAKNDAQFGIILPSLQQLLTKLSVKRGSSLEWCLNSISNYIEKIPTTELQLEGDERKLIDSDPNIRRVTKVYSMLPTFYKPFVDEMLVGKAKPNVKTKQIITAFLISLLGKPMILIDIDLNANAKSEARQASATIMHDICKLVKDLLKFLTYLEMCYKETKTQKSKTSEGNSNEHEIEPYGNREKINLTTLSGLYYCAYSGHFELPDLAIPQVYSVEYLIHTLLIAVNHMLSFSEYGPLYKGLALCQSLINRLGNHTSYELLLSSVHFDLLKSLTNVAIYCNYQSLRKCALDLITAHVNKFDYRGRCMLIKYLIETCNHSGMIGHSISLYKNALTEAFKEPVLSDSFTGVQLSGMIRKICHLPHGVESDLMELADQIITALNFLTFLIMKDKKNLTGIKELFSIIETEYMEVLRTALKMSKAHYELKLKDIITGKPDEEVNVSLSVGGSVLDSIPTDKKQEIIESALNGFHLMECLLGRLTELMSA